MERKPTGKTTVLILGPLLAVTAVVAYCAGVQRGRAAGRAELAAQARQEAETRAVELVMANGHRLELAIRALRGESSSLDALRHEKEKAAASPASTVLEEYDAKFVRWLCARVESALAAAATHPAGLMELEERLVTGREFLSVGGVGLSPLLPLPPWSSPPPPAAQPDAEATDIEKKMNDARTLLDFRNPPPGTFEVPVSP